MDLLPAYRELVCSPAQLASCLQADTVDALLQQLRRLWGVESAGDGDLVAELNRCNQQVLDLDPRLLEATWFPHRYHAATRSIAWCLPRGHATEPFQDQYIESCRRQGPFNQIIQPRVGVAPLLSAARPASPAAGSPADVPVPAPAGFIFHLSRCGSTLVSGCLSELDDTCVLSESPLLTDALLDASLSHDDQRTLLPQLVRLQAAVFPGRGRIVIKWNAWDLMALPVINAAFPGVPALLLLRDPEEILASHAASTGRHMSGDPSLAALGPEFAAAAGGQGVLGRRIGVLRALMQAMAGVAGASTAMTLDYASLDADRLSDVCGHFGLAPGADAHRRMIGRMAVHSKAPDRAFQPDGPRKRGVFDAGDKQRIHAALGAAYRGLLAAGGGAPAITARAGR